MAALARYLETIGDVDNSPNNSLGKKKMVTDLAAETRRMPYVVKTAMEEANRCRLPFQFSKFAYD